MASRTITLDVLARVEGERALTLVLDGATVVEARLKLFEPPRLFEAMMRGRACTEAHPMNEGRLVSTRGLDITAREFGDHIREDQSHTPHARHTARV